MTRKSQLREEDPVWWLFVLPNGVRIISDIVTKPEENCYTYFHKNLFYLSLNKLNSFLKNILFMLNNIKTYLHAYLLLHNTEKDRDTYTHLYNHCRLYNHMTFFVSQIYLAVIV